nr:hypothetical protein [Haliangium ochraceum]
MAARVDGARAPGPLIAARCGAAAALTSGSGGVEERAQPRPRSLGDGLGGLAGLDAVLARERQGVLAAQQGGVPVASAAVDDDRGRHRHC